MDELQAVVNDVAARNEAKAAFDKADTALRESIRAAIVAGVKVPALVEVTGLSRPRIYQIRDGRR